MRTVFLSSVKAIGEVRKDVQ